MTEAVGHARHEIGDVDSDVFVLAAADLDRVRGWHVPALIVVDAMEMNPPALPVLARLVMLRRRVRAAGGDLVVAASPNVARVLRRNGLHWAVPCADDVSSAVEAVVARGRIARDDRG